MRCTLTVTSKRRILCVFPAYTPSFGTFSHAYPLMGGVKAFMPPQGLLLIAAYLPKNWQVRFIDENIRPTTKEDFEWAEAAAPVPHRPARQRHSLGIHPLQDPRNREGPGDEGAVRGAPGRAACGVQQGERIDRGRFRGNVLGIRDMMNFGGYCFYCLTTAALSPVLLWAIWKFG